MVVGDEVVCGEGGESAGAAGDEDGAVGVEALGGVVVGRWGCAGEAGGEELAVTQGELGFAGGEGFGQVWGVGWVVGVDEVDAAGVFVLGGAYQSP